MATVKGWSAVLTLLMITTSIADSLDTLQDQLEHGPLRRNEYDLLSPKNYPSTNIVRKYLDDSRSNDETDLITKKNIRKKEDKIKTNIINKMVGVVPGESTEDSRPNDEVETWDTNDTHSVWSVSNSLKSGGWAMVISKLNEAAKVLSHQYSGMRLLLDIGDKIDYSLKFVDELDPSFSIFLFDQISPLRKNLSNILTYINIVGDGNNLVLDLNDFMKIFVSKTAQVFIASAQKMIKDYLSVEGLKEYYTTLLHTNPMEAQALDFVLNLIPDSDEVDMGRARYKRSRLYSYEKRKTAVDRHDNSNKYIGDRYEKNGRSYGHSGDGFERRDRNYGHSGGGYGHSGGDYGHGMGGYGHSESKSYCFSEPCLLVAGLGAATLLAYLAFHVLLTTTTTTTPRYRGSGERIVVRRPRFLDYSNHTDTTFTTINMIETAAVEYKDEEDGMADLSNSLNFLWKARQKEGGCVRCALKDRLQGGIDHLSMPRLIIAGAAQLMGAERVWPLLDELSAPTDPQLSDPVTPHPQRAPIVLHPLSDSSPLIL